jgi:acetoin utilization deacetylase AcuC-like enzyme
VYYYRSITSLQHDPGALSPDHPDSPERLLAIETAMARVDWLGCAVHAAPAAPERELELVHDPAHIRRIRDICARGGGQIDEDTYVGEKSYVAALHSAGGACEMVRALVGGETDAAFCATRPAGHHAERSSAMGFCLFNNVAIAAELAIRELGVGRVAIIDWDVHHGNGTAEIFRRRSDVLFASIHQGGLYPGSGLVTDAGSGEGRGYTINVPVPVGADELTWLSVLEYVVLPATIEFRPELVLISAGFDAHRADPLADCALQTGSFAKMACHVRDMAAAMGAPVGAVLEGGYDPGVLADCVLATVAALGGEGSAESVAPDPFITSRVAAHVGHYWSL